MAITTYEFYSSTYNGDSVDESSFSKWETIAEGKLNQLLCGNLTNDNVSSYNTEIQNALCQIVDLLFAFDLREKNPNDTNNSSVKSMSSGGQSVTFNSNANIIDNALGSTSNQDRLMLDKITPYLYGTNLLCKGVM